MSLTHIETIELGSSQSSITFSSIPQDYDDLIIKVSARGDNSGANARTDLELNVNGSAASFDLITLQGKDSGAVQSNSATATANFQIVIPDAGATSATFGNASVYISNYKSSSDKSVSLDYVAENNSAARYMLGINAALLSSSAAITSMSLSPATGDNVVAGSVFSLYGVTAGGDGTVTTS